MIILKIIVMLFSLIIIPELIGLLLTKFIKEYENNICLALVIGYLIEFAICQLVAVPMIFMQAKFTTLFYTYIAILILFSVISIIVNRKRFKEIIIENFNNIKEMPKTLTILIIILIGIQVYGLVGYMHEDADDAFYIATATTSVQTNSLFKYAAQDGVEYGKELPLRYVLGPFPMYYAISSQAISVHPAIFAHTIMPIVFIPITYVILGLIANELFDKNKKNVMLFLFLSCFLYIWGNYSIRNNFSFLLFRIWQGKSVLANIIIPSVWLFYIIAQKNDFKLANYIMLFIVIFAGTFTTTMGVALPPMILILLVIADEISKINFREFSKERFLKSILKIMKCLACCLPAIICGLMYFIL